MRNFSLYLLYSIPLFITSYILFKTYGLYLFFYLAFFWILTYCIASRFLKNIGKPSRMYAAIAIAYILILISTHAIIQRNLDTLGIPSAGSDDYWYLEYGNQIADAIKSSPMETFFGLSVLSSHTSPGYYLFLGWLFAIAPSDLIVRIYSAVIFNAFLLSFSGLILCKYMYQNNFVSNPVFWSAFLILNPRLLSMAPVVRKDIFLVFLMTLMTIIIIQMVRREKFPISYFIISMVGTAFFRPLFLIVVLCWFILAKIYTRDIKLYQVAFLAILSIALIVAINKIWFVTGATSSSFVIRTVVRMEDIRLTGIVDSEGLGNYFATLPILGPMIIVVFGDMPFPPSRLFSTFFNIINNANNTYVLVDVFRFISYLSETILVASLFWAFNPFKRLNSNAIMLLFSVLFISSILAYSGIGTTFEPRHRLIIYPPLTFLASIVYSRSIHKRRYSLALTTNVGTIGVKAYEISSQFPKKYAKT